MTRAGSPRLLFVGRRPGALAAARHLGAEVVAVVESPSPPSARRVICEEVVRSFAGPDEGWQELARRLAAPRPFAAIFALQEQAVVPAAHMRRALGLPGLDAETARCCTDKALMKAAVNRAGIDTARFVTSDEGHCAEALIERLGLPLVVKPRSGQGGRGRSICRTADEVPAFLPERSMAESFVSGSEMSIESLLCGGELVFVNPTEYLEPGWSNIVPATLEPDVARQVKDLNRRALVALGLADGIAHLELFLTAEGPVFGEVAARPPGGYLMDLIGLAYGFDAWEAWIALALGGSPPVAGGATGAVGVRLLHPGPGRIRTVEGVDSVQAVAGIERFRLRVEAGDVVSPRIGVGQEVGHVIVRGRDRDEVAHRIELVTRVLRITLEA